MRTQTRMKRVRGGAFTFKWPFKWPQQNKKSSRRENYFMRSLFGTGTKRYITCKLHPNSEKCNKLKSNYENWLGKVGDATDNQPVERVKEAQAAEIQAAEIQAAERVKEAQAAERVKEAQAAERVIQLAYFKKKWERASHDSLTPFIKWQHDLKRSRKHKSNKLHTIDAIPNESDMFVIINGFKFEAIGKDTHSARIHIAIRSTNVFTNESVEFTVYASLSELFCWRFCSYAWGSQRYFKAESKGKYADYVQNTLIHLDLQKFLNSKQASLPENPDIKCIRWWHYNTLLSSFGRVIMVEPFRSFYKMQKFKTLLRKQQIELMDEREKRVETQRLEYNPITNECGSGWREEDMNELVELSEQIKQKYNVVNVEYKYTMKQVDFTLDSMTINLMDYDVFTCVLKSRVETDKTNVLLHYIRINTFATKGTKENEPFTCNNVYTPIGLTFSPLSTINAYGLYDSYIPAGRYICKFLDYTIQFAREEIDKKVFPRVTESYTYIASIYQTLFPYTDPEFQRLQHDAVSIQLNPDGK